MPICYITFDLLFDDSNRLNSSEDNYDSDFKNTPDLDELEQCKK
jgi:hypothetical protein